MASGSVHAVQASTYTDRVHPGAARLPPNPSPGSTGPSVANYDEQIGLTFTQSFTTIVYNVTALAQSDSDGYGPGYLLNGLSSGGYWYQIGVVYNWPYSTGGYDSGFHAIYTVFDSSGTVVAPSNNHYVFSFSGAVYSNDVIRLDLQISGGNVQMEAYDWNTGANASQSYSAEGSEFVGLSNTANSNGFFSGLMTEWYHVNAYHGGESAVTYSNRTLALSSGYIWADEYEPPCCSNSQFADYQLMSFQNPLQIQTFSTNGAAATADAYEFITGSLTTGILTLSYSVQGGGYGYIAPILTYTYNGVQNTASLTNTPTTYFVDIGSSWLVSNILSSGSPSERWLAGSATSGTVNSSVTENILYQHQYLVKFSYSIHDGGSPASEPTVQYMQTGATESTTPGLPVWADAGSAYIFQNPLPGSTVSERWDDNGASGTIGAAGTLNVTYYHQFAVAASYKIIGGGSPVPPSETGREFGSLSTTQLGSQNTTVWFDSGTEWNITNPLNGNGARERWQSAATEGSIITASLSVSVAYYHQYALNLTGSILGGGTPTPPTLTGSQYGKPFAVVFTKTVTDFFDAGANWTLPMTLAGSSSSERWITMGPTSGVVVGQSAIQANYTHQFYVTTSISPASGGSITNSTGWHDAGATVRLSAFADSGWKFEGWAGSGNGAYTGSLNQSSIQANGPFSENATFYPGLKITAGNYGGVNYSYGAQSGTVPAGTTSTIYAPLGSVVSLSANPSSFLYQFSGWAPVSAGSTGQTTVRLQTPASIQASFSLSLLTLGVIIGAVVAVALITVFAMRRRSKPSIQSP